jgi:hypothetical protein
MTTLSDWLELFYLQAVLPEQNDIILLLTIENSITPLFALNFATCSGIPLRLATLYRPPLAAWREAVWHEAVAVALGVFFVRFASFPHQIEVRFLKGSYSFTLNVGYSLNRDSLNMGK